MARALTDIRSLARTHTETAINTLTSIAASPDAPAAARVAAAEALLNRGWGKPKEHIEISANAFDGLADADLATILAAVRAGRGLDSEDRAGADQTTH